MSEEGEKKKLQPANSLVSMTLAEFSKICILGAGAFGFAIAHLLTKKYPSALPIHIYDPDERTINSILKSGEHPSLFQGAKLSACISATTESKEAIRDSELIIVAVPVNHLRDCMKHVAQFTNKDDVIILDLSKGIEPKTNKLIHKIVEEEMRSSQHKHRYAVLSGGMIAEDVVKGDAVAADVASHDSHVAKTIQRFFQGPKFRVSTPRDVNGIEFAMAAKNALAIGAGIIDGLSLGGSTKAAFISIGAAELRDLAVTLGGKKETFDVGGQAGIGDLLTTCFGKSRNLDFGQMIGSGKKPKEALQELEKKGSRAEGYPVIGILKELCESKNVKSTVIEVLYNLMHKEDIDPREEFLKIFAVRESQ